MSPLAASIATNIASARAALDAGMANARKGLAKVKPVPLRKDH